MQVYTGQDAEAKAAIYVIHNIYQQNETEDVLSFDEKYDFNSVIRKVILHNTFISCPSTNKFYFQLLSHTKRLFFIGNEIINEKPQRKEIR